MMQHMSGLIVIMNSLRADTDFYTFLKLFTLFAYYLMLSSGLRLPDDLVNNDLRKYFASNHTSLTTKVFLNEGGTCSPYFIVVPFHLSWFIISSKKRIMEKL